jgi:hypothetical protein
MDLVRFPHGFHTEFGGQRMASASSSICQRSSSSPATTTIVDAGRMSPKI